MSGVEVVLVIGLVAAAAAAVIFLRPKNKGVGQERQDLEISDSAFGNFIPIGRGRVKLTGDLIYAREIIVEENKSKVGKGGAGGGSPSQKTFEYFLDGIYILADASIFGPAKEFIKVWADTELIYDVTREQELDVKDDVIIRFKFGNENQEPDIMQIEDEGILAQGFPFSVLIALEKFPLKYSSDRPPSLSAEIDFERVTVITLVFELEGVDDHTDNFPPRWYHIDYNRRRIYAAFSGSSSTDPFETWFEYDLDTLDEIDTHDVTGNITGAAEFRGIDQRTGYLVGWNPISSPDFDMNLYVYDPDDKIWITDFVVHEPLFIFMPSGFDPQHYPIITSPAGNRSAIFSTDFDNVAGNRRTILNFPDLSFNSHVAPPIIGGSIPWSTGSMNARHENDTAWAFWISDDNVRFMSYKLDNTGIITTTSFPDIHRTVFHATDIFVRTIVTCPYIDSDKNVLINFNMKVSGGSLSRGFYIKYNPGTQTLDWQTEILDQDFIEVADPTRAGVRLGNTILRDSLNDKIHVIDIQTGAIVNDPVISDSEDNEISSGAIVWDGKEGRLYTVNTFTAGFNVFKTWIETRDDTGSVDLADIIREICVRVDLVEGTDFDVSAVTGSVWGWKIKSRTKANEALADVMQPFFLQAGTQDGLIKFITRNENSLATIDIGEFLQDEDNPDTLPFTITEEDEASLPSEVNVGYDDPTRDYEPGNAAYRRPEFPDSPIQSHEKLDIETSFALTALQAKEIAYRWTYIPWLERDSIKGRLDWTHIEYVGNDIVTFNIDGVNKKARVTKASLKNDWTIDIEAVFIEPGASIAASFAASSGDFTRISSIEPAPDTQLHVLDINLLRDKDDLLQLASLGYLSLGPENPPNTSWIGAGVFRSIDQVDYEPIAASGFSGIFGITNELLNTPADPFGTKFDDTLDVLIPSGKGTELANINYQSLLNSGNPFIVIKSTGHEICQFQTITNLGSNVFRLSILKRGQRGTDTQVGGNLSGDLVIFPNTTNIEKFSTIPTNIGKTFFFRGVTADQAFNDVSDFTKIMTGNDLKPYAPFHFKVVREVNDDLTITFNRRTRVGAGVVNGNWRAPLNEAISSFEVDTYDATGVTINRTIASATESFTYIAADQTTDGLSLSATTVWIAIFQLSDLVGRGYSYKLEITVE